MTPLANKLCNYMLTFYWMVRKSQAFGLASKTVAIAWSNRGALEQLLTFALK